VEKELNQSENNFGCGLMAKAEELFKKDAQNGLAKYSFPEEESKSLIGDLQKLGFKKFLEKSIGEPIFLISPQKIKIIEIEKYGTFLVPPIVLRLKRKFLINQRGEIIDPVIKELGETDGFELILTTETIPKKENISYQYQRLVLSVNNYHHYFFLEENFFTSQERKGEETDNLEVNAMKRTGLKEIKLFQEILNKNLEKIKDY